MTGDIFRPSHDTGFRLDMITGNEPPLETMSEADCDRMERAAEHVEQANELCRLASLEIERLKEALRKIAAYPPGDFRGLEDEIAIWKIATDALTPVTSTSGSQS